MNMGSRMSGSLDLARRCKKVGWRVEDTSRGIKVYNSNGRPYVIHRTYSDVNSLKNATTMIESGGLLEAEANMAELKFQEAQTRTSTARKAAAKKAAELTEKGAQLAAVAKAAGPYLSAPEDVLIGWFADKHPAPWMRWVNITPEIAQYLLDSHNNRNRPLVERQVQHYRNIILSGQWHLTHQGIAMDTEAILQDGQHRLAAVVDIGDDIPDLKVPFAFFVGMPIENFKAIDEGLVRTAAHLFARGDVKNGGTMQTAIRLIIAYRDQNARGRYRLKMTNEQIMDAYEEDPGEFQAAASVAQSHYRKVFSAAGAFAAARYLIRKTNGPDNKFVEAFFDGLMTGRKAGTRLVLDDDDPRAVYRETMQQAKLKGKRITGLDQMGMMILSWNNLINNYRPRYMRFADDAPIPRVMVCKDQGKDASACPALLVGELDDHEDDE